MEHTYANHLGAGGFAHNVYFPEGHGGWSDTVSLFRPKKSPVTVAVRSIGKYHLAMLMESIPTACENKVCWLLARVKLKLYDNPLLLMVTNKANSGLLQKIQLGLFILYWTNYSFYEILLD